VSVVGDVPDYENLKRIGKHSGHSLYRRGSCQHHLSHARFYPAFDCNVVWTRRSNAFSSSFIFPREVCATRFCW